jgi:hypothetical protein
MTRDEYIVQLPLKNGRQWIPRVWRVPQDERRWVPRVWRVPQALQVYNTQRQIAEKSFEGRLRL